MSDHEKVTDLFSPQSRFYHGPYGRMFRMLPAYTPPPKRGDEFEGVAQTEADIQSRQLATLQDLADSMLEGVSDFNQLIPAGYTYFGQFVTHDITFDPVSSLQRRNDPDKLTNFRTPRFDLDSLYGSGPSGSPFMYNQKLKTTDGKQIEGVLLISHNEEGIDDLPRNEQGWALIGDPRNDENLIISQLQLAFIKFHNRIMEDLSEQYSKVPSFYEAQRIVRWHYQYVVVNDFLERLVGPKTFEEVFPRINSTDGESYVRRPNLRFYNYKENPFMPVEFSAAAFRIGHVMIRGGYRLNDAVDLPIFRNSPEGDDTFIDLRGNKVLPATGEIQWKHFLDLNGSSALQHSQKFDTKLAEEIQDMPFKDEFRSLALRDLIRSWRMGLPSGQAIARFMGIDPIYNPRGDDSLWWYILKEAEESSGGIHLGPVGGTIVAEVFVGLLKGDPLSYINIEPNWTPAKERIIDTIKAAAEEQRKADQDNDREVKKDFQLRDIIYYATKPRP